MDKATLRKVAIIVIAVFVLTLIAYPLLFNPKSLEPGVDGTAVDIETPGDSDAMTD